MESGIHWGKSVYVHSESCEMSGFAWCMKASKLRLDVRVSRGKRLSIIRCSRLNHTAVKETDVLQLSQGGLTVRLTPSTSHNNGFLLSLLKVPVFLKNLIKSYAVAGVSGLQGVFL